MFVILQDTFTILQLMKILFTTLFSLLFITANAGVIIVTNTNDAGAGSLRQAVNDANANDTIRFDPLLINGGDATLTLVSEITFDKSLVIIGLYNSSDTLYISGNNVTRHFNITDAGNVTLDSLVLINGSSSGNGGAISIEESDTLFIKNSIIKDNRAVDYGGGISYYSTFSPTSPAIVFVTNSVISDNTAGDSGGGIFSMAASSTSSILVFNSTIDGNVANANYGGGMYSRSNTHPSSVQIENSTVSNNKATNSGGGIHTSSSSSSSSVLISKSTISGNEAESSGGGILSSSSSVSFSSVIIESSTISQNIAVNGDGGGICANASDSSYVSILNSTLIENVVDEFGNGGGIYAYAFSNASVLEVSSSIIWTNGTSNIVNGGGAPSFTSHGFNIFSNSPIGVTSSDSVNVSIASLSLQPLAFNGGTTKTMLPNANSIAIDAGNPLDISDAQNRTIVGRRDIGAAERSCSVILNETKIACGSFTWRNGITYTSDTSDVLFEKIGVAAGGCDSLYSLNLTIHTVDVAITQNGNNLSANETGATYQWIDCNDNNAVITDETNQTFTATENGSYAVIVSKNGCSDTSACLTINNVGFTNSNEIIGVNIFPNPTKDEVTIRIENIQNGHYSFELMDASGRIISSQLISENSTNLNLSNYQAGVYVIRIMNGNMQSVQRIIKK